MDGFTKLPKMQCFKEGGSVKSKIAAFEKKETKSEVKMDKAQDKSMVKKGVRQHESALHKGEPKTELKLKTGGRAKKAAGTVKKFEKASGEYGAKKTATDKKNIKEAKKFVPAFKEGGKACAPSAAKKAKNTPAKMCGGKSVNKMADGGQPGATEAQQKYYNKNKADAKVKEDKALYEAVGSRGDAARKGMAEGRMDQMGTAYKKGGKAKVKKFAEGGSTGSFSPDEEKWLGGADRTDPFILARMRAAMGDKKPAPAPAPSGPVRSTDIARLNDMAKGQGVFAEGSEALPGAGLAAAPSAPVRSTDISRLNEMAQGQGVFPEGSAALPTSVAPARPKPRPVRSTDIARLNQMAQGQGVFPEGSEALPTRPYAAPNVEQDSGLEYPVKPGFFNATPGQQATQFNRGAQQRKNVGRKIGDFFGLNKKPVA